MYFLGHRVGVRVPVGRRLPRLAQLSEAAIGTRRKEKTHLVGPAGKISDDNFIVPYQLYFWQSIDQCEPTTTLFNSIKVFIAQ